MAHPVQAQSSFLDQIVARSSLTNTNDAQRAANVVFRILRDMMSNATDQRIQSDLSDRAPDSEIVDLWQDLNVMVAFFSRLSPVQNLHIKPGTFMLRLQQEAALPRGVSPEEVTQAVFSATKEILSPERSRELSGILPAELRQLWERA